MAQVEIPSALKKKLLSAKFDPAIVAWNRLEGRPRRADFDRSLAAEVRDPLWMLCRQWQFGEFQGEDAGSSVDARVQVRSTHLNRYAGLSRQAVGYDDALPLEVRVEREPVLGQPVDMLLQRPCLIHGIDLLTRAEIGRHWLKLVDNIGSYRALYVQRFGFEDPPDGLAAAQLQSQPLALQTLAALKGRAVDGVRLLVTMAANPDEHAAWLASAVPDQPARAKILEAAKTFRLWFERVYGQPEPADDPAWSPSYLEYQFACSAPADPNGTAQTVLDGNQYHQGHLDWYSFDLAPQTQLPGKPGDPIPLPRFVIEPALNFIPVPIEFRGMPNVRWWEFEDSKVDFGNLRPSTTDLATLILAEFGLIYSNDWGLIPYVLDVGTLSEVMGIIVGDSFGVHTLIRPAVGSLSGERAQWGMYYLSSPGSLKEQRIDPRLFLPPALGPSQESAPLEKVIFARDEMANMVWAIEQAIPSPVTGGMDGFDAATQLAAYFEERAQPSAKPAPPATGANIRYRLGTRVSENWIPLIPVNNPGTNRKIRLQRASMPRLIQDAPKLVEPRGAILRVGLDEQTPQPYFIHEEEVPKAGVIVTRTFQRARWWNGGVFTWLGRRKQTGKGQGSSGLEFDRIEPIDR